jgi:murein DD-endopeptidase MepM/ murein hydrolase activator NlpD
MKSIKQFLKSYLFLPVCIVAFIFLIAIASINKIISHNTLSSNPLLASINKPPPPLLESIFEKDNTYNQSKSQAVPTKITGKITRGDSIAASFRKNNISESVKNEFLTSLKGVLNFKQLKPGDRYTITLDENGRLAQAVYEASPLEIYTLTRTAHGLRAALPDVTVERRTVQLEGTITSSLFSAFTDQGIDARLIYAFADIFASKIDFNTETHTGDTFKVLVESYYKAGSLLGYGRILQASYWQSEENNALEGYYFSPDGVTGSYYDLTGKELGTSFIKSPVPVGRVTSNFTYTRRHPILNTIRPHLGIDLAAPQGTPIMAAADGTVQSIGRNGGYGNQIVLNHGGDYQTYYGHLAGFKSGLTRGSRVKQKEIIGYVGSTGLSTGSHLDYRVQYHGAFMNPFAMKFKPRSILQGVALASLQKQAGELQTLVASAPNNGKILRVTQITVNAKNKSSILL